ncbi:hypothetical protein SAMN05428989_0235 [Pseudoxanthomonas sp. GM95]|uniref:hypothetical protein n=1 Tax=Pseudoxanthomonas sp. GM95 TaxID=1881043 RepID=UPI0008B5EFE4|nr:hypothetical protein [Pseudoxanthomonas sp. GM95]SEK50243.1 hypothetical protein SAMN05428989_0235 [Pseudoxanthomonas sp. GM95]
MDKIQADAIIRALLTPDPQHRADVAFRREREARQLLRQRRMAWLSLAGVVLGATCAVLLDQRLVVGALWGGICGQLLGHALNPRPLA